MTDTAVSSKENKPMGIRLAFADLIRRSTPAEFGNGFRILFRAFLASMLILGGGWFLWKAAFMSKHQLNEHTGIIVGAVIGTFLGSIVGFYFGGQDRNRKQEVVVEEEKEDLPPTM
jgi:hypothetical protein